MLKDFLPGLREQQEESRDSWYSVLRGVSADTSGLEAVGLDRGLDGKK